MATDCGGLFKRPRLNFSECLTESQLVRRVPLAGSAFLVFAAFVALASANIVFSSPVTMPTEVRTAIEIVFRNRESHEYLVSWRFHRPVLPFTRRLTLIELVKVDFEQRWTHKTDPKSVEQCFDEWPELKEPDGLAPCDFVCEEFHIRRQSGEDVRLSKFVARFPGLADRLKRLIGQAESVESSSMRAESRQKMTLPPGDTIDDFDLLTRLGSGVFATVFRARQKSMQRLCGAED